MAPSNGVKKPSDNVDHDVGGGSGAEPKAAASPAPPQISKVNGDGIHHFPSKTEAKNETIVGGENVPEGEKNAEPSALDSSVAPPANDTNATVDKPDPASKVESDSTQKSNPRDEEWKLEAQKPTDEPQDLGAILKGAPFEHEPGGDSNALDGENSAPPESTLSPPKKTSELDHVVSGSPSKPQTAAKPTSKPKPSLGSSRPSAINSRRLSSKAPKAGATTSNEVSTGSPKTPNSPNVAGRHASPKTASPRQLGPSKAPNHTNRESRKEPIPRTNRLSIGTKVPEAAGEKSTSAPNGNSAKKLGPMSPITKLRPKSPIRPARLPAAATAPTASSAAKVGEAPPSRSPSRSSVSNIRKPAVLGRDRAAPSSNARKSTSRVSLPAASNESQKPKARVNAASVKAPEGSFLARMMRPTQSSASKTHEKVEHAVTKSHPTRPKRKSGGSEEDARGPGVEEPPPAIQQEDEHAAAPTTVPAEDVNRTEAASTDAAATQ